MDVFLVIGDMKNILCWKVEVDYINFMFLKIFWYFVYEMVFVINLLFFSKKGFLVVVIYRNYLDLFRIYLELIYKDIDFGFK